MPRRSKESIEKERALALQMFYDVVNNREIGTYEDAPDEQYDLAYMAQYDIRDAATYYAQIVWMFPRESQELLNAAKALLDYMAWVKETYL